MTTLYNLKNMETKTLLSKPNLKRLLSLYRIVLQTHRHRLPFTLTGVCNEAAMSDFRNARQFYNNTQFNIFCER
jgi:hypothetical protein